MSKNKNVRFLCVNKADYSSTAGTAAYNSLVYAAVVPPGLKMKLWMKCWKLQSLKWPLEAVSTTIVSRVKTPHFSSNTHFAHKLDFVSKANFLLHENCTGDDSLYCITVLAHSEEELLLIQVTELGLPTKFILMDSDYFPMYFYQLCTGLWGGVMTVLLLII